jgi:hypothetical protein
MNWAWGSTVFKNLLITSLVSFAVLILPDWKPPYSYGEALFLLLAYAGAFGPWFLMLALILNRLANISFRTK